MDDKTIDEKKLKERLDYYIGKNVELHIVHKAIDERTPEWWNCFIISKDSDGVYIVKERKFGRRTLFVSTIAKFEECKEKGAQRIGHGWEYKG